jgi:hypothetical protein
MSINLLMSIKIIKLWLDLFILSSRKQMTIVDMLFIYEVMLYWNILLPMIRCPVEKVDEKLRIRLPKFPRK